MKTAMWGAGALACTLALAACGDDDYEGAPSEPSNDAGSSRATSSSSSGASDAAAALEVSVVSDATALTPVERALVALGYGDGTTELAQSDAAGKARFVSASLGSGIVSISTGRDDAAVRTTLLAAPLQTIAEPLIVKPRIIANNTVKVSGTIANKAQAGDSVQLSTLSNGGTFLDTKPAFSLAIEKETPTQLIGQVQRVGSDPTLSSRGFYNETVAMFHVSLPASSIDVVRDLDLATLAPDTTHLVDTTVKVPGGADGPLGGPTSYAFVSVYSLAPRGATFVYAGVTGVPERGDLEAAGDTWNVRTRYADIPEATPYTTASIVLASGANSYVNVPGLPTAGAVYDGFLTPVPVTVKRLSPGDTIDIPASATDSTVTLVAYGDVGVLWSVSFPGPGSFELPVLPADLAAFAKGTGTRVAYIDVCQQQDPTTGVCARQAQTANVRYAP